MRPKHTLLVLVGVALGVALGWRLFGDVRVPSQEDPAAAIILPSGGVVAERIPDAPLPPVAHEAARELGGTVARAGSVTVQPRTPDAAPSETPAAGSAGPVASCPCKPITLDWTLTSLRDGSSRMSWYTDDGTITEAVDIPVSGGSRRDRPWAAGVEYDPMRDRIAGFIDRDFGRARIGLSIGDGASVRIGLRW